MTPLVLGPVTAALLSAYVVAWLHSREALHMFQMDSYISGRYLRWLAAKPLKRLLDPLAPAVAFVSCLRVESGDALLLLAWPAYALFRILKRDRTPPKKPLDMTARARRMLATCRVLLAVLALAFLYLIAAPLPYMSARHGAAAFPASLCSLLLIHLAPFALLAANQIMLPVQAHINRGFIRAAQQKIERLHPIVVGVAGSYGKTSAKYFIDTLLSQKYKTLKTPGNVNTQLGVTRIVNENLTAEHEVFIVEMGAYKRGEVKDVADIVHPSIGIITSIGPEHFERFLTMENIEETNYEVIAPLPPDGLAVFNCESEHCRKLADRTRHVPVARYALAEGSADAWAEEIEHTADGLRFTIALKDGTRLDAATALVGRHNVQNILGAVLIARHLGVSNGQIVEGVRQLKPAPNRLEVKRGAAGTIIIDDSYNSNPFGAAEALHVLKQFTTGKRVLVTPGMIELGVLQEEKNRELGESAASCCDLVILVGPEQTRPIAEGLRRAGFQDANLHIVKNLGEATGVLQKILRPGDVILFENDLPDLYNE
jgi:UDP-N-acetylmuramoyl-tripeptide--D-alanyl-D-alanine ligase